MRTIEQLKTKADALFRRYLHAINPDRVKCKTCMKVFPNQAMTVGHIFRRNLLPMRWDIRFAVLQCWPCNSSGKDEILLEWWKSQHPDWESLVAFKRKELIKRPELEMIISDLEDKIKNLP